MTDAVDNLFRVASGFRTALEESAGSTLEVVSFSPVITTLTRRQNLAAAVSRDTGIDESIRMVDGKYS